MPGPLVTLMAAAALLGAADAALAGVTPIQKVIELLNGMVAKGQAEQKAEQVSYASFAQWADDSVHAKMNEITAADEQFELLNALIMKSAARIRSLNDRFMELEDDVGRWKKDTVSASDVRSKEAADYRATTSDYSESLDALTQAIAVLQKQGYDRAQAESALLQVHGLQLVPLKAKKALQAFLQQGVLAVQPEELSVSAPDANAYEFQSGGIVDMLEKLKDEFRDKKAELDRDELNAKHAAEQILQTLADSIENAEHEISNKRTASSESAQSKAEAEGTLAQTISDRDEDKKYLSDLQALAAQKARDYESRQKLRGEELAAIQKAIEIISSQAVAGSGEKHLPALMEIHKGQKGVSLAHLRSSQTSPLQARIATFLADRAQSLNSRLLTLVSEKVATDPFNKVKKMIKDLLVKLMEEGTAETEHKGWCDTELTTNKQTRDAKGEDVDKLTSQVEGLQAEIAQLGQVIQDLAAQVKELDGNMAEATENRNESKGKHEETINEAKDAQIALQQAIAVLKDFYAKSAEATALAQQSPADDAPETFDKPYQGLLPEGGNVVDFLEVILSDFSRLEADTATAEATEQEQYETFTFESKKDKALKENESEHKSHSVTNKESALHATQAELKATQEQLNAAMTYYDKLKPTCVDSGISYEDRVRRREEELQSLQEALKILTGTDVNLS